MSPLKLRSNRMLMLLTAAALLWRFTLVDVHAQSGFQSGSTGADGAFSPTTSQAVQLPENGIFNFTTVNIPAGVTITFLPNSRNTPVIILATGNVVIQGTIDINGQSGDAAGQGGAPGPGGFSGGAGANGVNQAKGNAGDGPGAGGGGGAAPPPPPGPGSRKPVTSGVGGIGSASGGHGGGAGFHLRGTDGDTETGGRAYATAAMINLIGGSGGGGGGAVAGSGHSGGGGGGGAGAIVIASSGAILFGDESGNPGEIEAEGGYGSDGDISGGGGPGGGGSGGAIRLVANTISGTAELNVSGGETGASGIQLGLGSHGYVRVEAPEQSNLNAITPFPISQALPNSAIPANPPRLRIASVGGVAAPASPVGSFHAAPDLMVPASQANPISVAIEAINVPVGTVVQVTVIPVNGTRATVDADPLAGTATSSTATASVDLPAETSAVVATAEINLLTSRAAPLFIDGERVDRLVVAAAIGSQSEVTYITKSGKRIKAR
jgi:hypothetical protein